MRFALGRLRRRPSRLTASARSLASTVGSIASKELSAACLLRRPGERRRLLTRQRNGRESAVPRARAAGVMSTLRIRTAWLSRRADNLIPTYHHRSSSDRHQETSKSRSLATCLRVTIRKARQGELWRQDENNKHIGAPALSVRRVPS